MQAGKLNSRVTLLSPVRTAAGTGEPATTWTAVKSVWAAISPASGKALRELGVGEMAGAGFSLGTVKVMLRFDPAFSPAPGWRIQQSNGVLLEVNYVADVANRHEQWELCCSEAQ